MLQKRYGPLDRRRRSGRIPYGTASHTARRIDACAQAERRLRLFEPQARMPNPPSAPYDVPQYGLPEYLSNDYTEASARTWHAQGLGTRARIGARRKRAAERDGMHDKDTREDIESAKEFKRRLNKNPQPCDICGLRRRFKFKPYVRHMRDKHGIHIVDPEKQ